MKLSLRLLVYALLTLAAAPAALAQPANLSGTSGTANYSFVRPGDLTMFVDVWGSVGSPGLYEIPQGTRLSTLLSYAGGPPLALREGQDQTLTLSVYRGAPGAREMIFETVMENNVRALETDPVLEPGDLVTAELVTEQRFAWRDVISVANTLLSLTLLALRVSRYR